MYKIILTAEVFYVSFNNTNKCNIYLLSKSRWVIEVMNGKELRRNEAKKTKITRSIKREVKKRKQKNIRNRGSAEGSYFLSDYNSNFEALLTSSWFVW